MRIPLAYAGTDASRVPAEVPMTLTPMTLTYRALTALGTVLMLAAGLWWSAGHLLLAPFGPSALAVTALAGAALVGALTVCLASGSRLVAITAAIPQLSHALAVR